MPARVYQAVLFAHVFAFRAVLFWRLLSQLLYLENSPMPLLWARRRVLLRAAPPKTAPAEGRAWNMVAKHAGYGWGTLGAAARAGMVTLSYGGKIWRRAAGSARRCAGEKTGRAACLLMRITRARRCRLRATSPCTAGAFLAWRRRADVAALHVLYRMDLFPRHPQTPAALRANAAARLSSFCATISRGLLPCRLCLYRLSSIRHGRASRASRQQRNTGENGGRQEE